MPEPHRLALHWFRRDLRLLDNTSLFHASRAASSVLPVYVSSDWRGFHAWTGSARQTFLCGCLESLSRNLATIGGRLVIRRGSADVELRKLLLESGATALFFNRDPDPFGREMELKVEAMCRHLGVECHGFHDVTLHHPDEVLTRQGAPYRVFTPFHRAWSEREKPAPLPKPGVLHSPTGIGSLPLPQPSDWGLPPARETIVEPGERAAHLRLKEAIERRIHHYSSIRDVPGADGTSRLSQDLRYGLLSVRTIFARVRSASNGDPGSSGPETFIKELAWREFYMAILKHHPEVLTEEFQPEWRGLPWREPDQRFEAWKTGRTGFPIVDAGMRELLATGHMHNRLRMITAMFLTKDLRVDWRFGEQHFLRHLVDGEIASNNGGWQWCAGTGADAAPYFRIQNPWLQAGRHDPDGTYIRRWIPELGNVPTKSLFRPPGGPLAPDYPMPCVDHRMERDRTLAMFKRHRAGRPA